MSIPDAGWWQVVSPYLDQALEMPDEERAAWIRSLRHEQPALAERLESLLQDHAMLAQERFLESGPAAHPSQPIRSGKVIGPYTLVRPIGEGGMGSVWLARRTDGEIQQTVAIKFLGIAGHRPAWRARFLRERQLLASLNHPSIVHVIDAGHTDDGRPYLAMEYVEGSPIDVYAERIPIADRLKLFLRVCDGVAYAHRRLIIHRDLKPSNILVDETGQPKLLDFGIAKLLDETGDVTQTIERMLTPHYASPEQVQGAAQTTATDIYSLGAVLHKLLTGRLPHDAQAAGTTDAAASALGDAAYVLRKALRVEPEERYASVEAFANDVRALLESRPVEARAGDRWYRTRKFLRRHRLPAAAAALVLLSLSAGLFAANRERAVAQRRFLQVRQLANRFIQLDEELRGLGGATKVRSRIVADSLQYLSALGLEAAGDTDLELEIATAYVAVAHVQGDPTSASLGQFSDAEKSLGNAESLVESILRRDGTNTPALALAAAVAHDRMVLADVQRRPDDALAYAGKAGEALDRWVAGGLRAGDAYTVARFYSNVVVGLENRLHFDEAVRYSERGLAITKIDQSAERARGPLLGALAYALWQLGRLDEAARAASESVERVAKEAAGGHTTIRANLVNALWRQGRILGGEGEANLGRPAEALAAFQKGLDLAEEDAQKDPNDYLSRHNVAKTSLEIGNILRRDNPQQALAVYDRALTRIRETKPNARSQRDEAYLLAASSYAVRARGREEEARQRIDDALRLARDLNRAAPDKIEPLSEADYALRALADYYAATGQLEKTVATYEELLAKMTAWNADPRNSLRDSTAFSETWASLARVLRGLDRTDEARALQTRRSDLWTHWAAKLPDNVFVRRQIQLLASL